MKRVHRGLLRGGGLSGRKTPGLFGAGASPELVMEREVTGDRDWAAVAQLEHENKKGIDLN